MIFLATAAVIKVIADVVRKLPIDEKSINPKISPGFAGIFNNSELIRKAMLHGNTKPIEQLVKINFLYSENPPQD